MCVSTAENTAGILLTRRASCAICSNSRTATRVQFIRQSRQISFKILSYARRLSYLR